METWDRYLVWGLVGYAISFLVFNLTYTLSI